MSKHSVVQSIRYAFLAAALFLVGCGPKELARKETYPVQGTLKIHGQPAAFVIINLEPVDGGKGVAAEGTTDAEGNFELRTYSNQGMDGAAAGVYTVHLEEYDPVRSGAKATKEVPPTKLPKEGIGEVHIEIKAGTNPPLEIDIP